MKREEIKTYKDACKVIGRKPRVYKEKQMNLYEQLSTIIAALNFISNDNKPWKPEFDYYYIYSYLYRKNRYNKTAGLFSLLSHGSLGYSGAYVGTSLKIKEYKDGQYILDNFKELLQDWFWGE